MNIDSKYTIKFRDDTSLVLNTSDDTKQHINDLNKCYVFSDISEDYDSYYEVLDLYAKNDIKHFIKITDSKPNNITVYTVNRKTNLLQNFLVTNFSIFSNNSSCLYVKVGKINLTFSVTE